MKHIDRAAHWPAILLMTAALALLYGQVRYHGLIDFDDTSYITENALVRDGLSLAGVKWAFSSFYLANWHPLTWLSHMLDVSLFGMDIGAHHLVNAALHGVVSVLVYVLGFRLLGRRDAALTMGLLFLVHPQHVESVAWLAERKDLLCAVFYLLALVAYHGWVLRPRPAGYACVALWLALALLSKPMAVTLPVVLLLLDAWPLHRFDESVRGGPRAVLMQLTRLVIEKLPLALMSLASCVITVLAQSRGGAVSGLDAMSVSERLANAVTACSLYLRDFVLPDRLAVFYPLQHIDLATDLLPALLTLCLVAGACIALRRRAPSLWVGLAWFLVTLLPVIGLVHVGNQARADRYMYIPSIGLLLGLAACLPPAGHAARRLSLALVSGATVFWGALCYMQIGYWESASILYTRSAEVTGQNLLLEVRLVDALIAEERFDEAMLIARATAQNHPRLYLGHLGIGNVLMAQGRLEEAETALRTASQASPREVIVLNNLGVVLLRLGKSDEGCALLRQAEQVAPVSVMVRENLQIGRCHSGGALDSSLPRSRPPTDS